MVAIRIISLLTLDYCVFKAESSVSSVAWPKPGCPDLFRNQYLIGSRSARALVSPRRGALLQLSLLRRLGSLPFRKIIRTIPFALKPGFSRKGIRNSERKAGPCFG